MTSTADAQAPEQERNKAIVRRCYEQFFDHGIVDGFEDFVDVGFLQHSPDSPSGRDAYLSYLKEAAFVGGRSSIKRVIADDDYVVVHHHLTLPGDDGPGVAVVDVWRLREGRAIEHWEVEQLVPEPDRVPNGMF
jgi:predicted SnoaL-like aldol condensation-catalyzing enzyme